MPFRVADGRLRERVDTALSGNEPQAAANVARNAAQNASAPRAGRFPAGGAGGGVARAARQRRRTRLVALALAVLTLGAATGLTLFALQDQVAFFQSPTDIAERPLEPGARVRLGGLVKRGSLERGENQARFLVTDGGADVAVAYSGILPDLFREGQGVVIDGAMGPGGTFVASTVLAKHDENYVPAEVAEALEERGLWRGNASVVLEGPAE